MLLTIFIIEKNPNNSALITNTINKLTINCIKPLKVKIFFINLPIVFKIKRVALLIKRLNSINIKAIWSKRYGMLKSMKYKNAGYITIIIVNFFNLTIVIFLSQA